MCTHSKSNATQQNVITVIGKIVQSSCNSIMHMYGLSAMSKQLCEDNYEFLDVVQWRLVKLWFGVSKFALTSSLLNAVECEKGSDLVRHRTKYTQPSAPFLCQITHCRAGLISRRVSRGEILASC